MKSLPGLTSVKGRKARIQKHKKISPTRYRVVKKVGKNRAR